MKYILLLALLLVVACSPVVDTRAPDVAAATRTAIANAPLSGNVGVLRIRLLTPPPVTIEPSLVPTVTPTPCDPVVKGNVSSDGRKLYHLAGMRNYEQVVIDEAKGEKTFCSEQEAIDAGWTKAGN